MANDRCILHYVASTLSMLTLSTSESIMETCSVILTSESVNKILWCDHSNETSSAVLLHRTFCFVIIYKLKFRFFLEFLCLSLLEVK